MSPKRGHSVSALAVSMDTIPYRIDSSILIRKYINLEGLSKINEDDIAWVW